MDEYLTGAQFAHKALLDGHLIARKNQRITELKDEAARKNQRITELKDEALQQTLTARRALRRAEKAEAHAADCKRLVTACENDIDAERMKRREAEACVERLWQLPHVCHRAEQAESELAALKGRRCETCAVNNDCEIQHAAQAGDLFYCAAWLLMNVAARADEGSE